MANRVQYRSKDLDVMFFNLTNILPKELHKVVFYKTKSEKTLIMYDKESNELNSVINQIPYVVNSINLSASTFIFNTIFDSAKEEMGNDIEYVYYVKPNIKSSVFINKAALFKLIKKFHPNDSIIDFSAKVGISDKTIYDMINGVGKNYTISSVLKLCKYFDVSPYYLINGMEKNFEKVMNKAIRKGILNEDDIKRLSALFFEDL